MLPKETWQNRPSQKPKKNKLGLSPFSRRETCLFLVSGRVAKKEGRPLQLDESQTYRKEEGDRKKQARKANLDWRRKRKKQGEKNQEKVFRCRPICGVKSLQCTKSAKKLSANFKAGREIKRP